MPTVYRPILLHILCDDLEYEKITFGNLEHQYSHVSQASTKTKQTASNESNATLSCSSIDATHYSILRLIILGNYKAFFENNNESTPFTTYPNTLNPSVCKEFCLKGFEQSSVNTLLVSQKSH